MDHADATTPGGDTASTRSSGHLANGRKWHLDDRERQADDREREADERDRRADERERIAQLRQRAVELRSTAASARGHAEQAVEVATAVLEANQDSVHRAEVALNRALANADRERANATGPVRPGEQRPALRGHDVADLPGRYSALRRKTAETAAQLADTEERAARMFDELAASGPGNPEPGRLADEAREAVRRAREAERKYSDV